MSLSPGIAEWYAEKQLWRYQSKPNETEVTMADTDDAPVLSEQTRLEIELGRKKVEEAAKREAAAKAQAEPAPTDDGIEVVEMKRTRRKTKVEDFPVTAPETFVAPPAAEPEPVTPKGKEPPAAPQSLDDLDEFLKS